MICFEQIGMQYRSNGNQPSKTVLQDINLSIGEGEFVCLIGPSGCGKTTLLNLLAGFLFPTNGRVLFRGEPVREPSPERAVVFQDPTLFPWLTVQSNLAFGLRCQKTDPDEIRAKTAEALKLVGLSGCEKAYIHQLSGGMRQRAALARVLVLDPPALLMDEPFGALDANTRENLQNQVLRIWRSRRRTILFVTHSVEEAAFLADRVVLMGPPPASVSEIVDLNLPRPRKRSAEAYREAADMLRRSLDAMPCCITPFTKGAEQ